MNNNTDSISVCIATYNGEKYIQQQLVSILNQIREDDEVIISDDGSTDNTLKKVEALDDNRIKIIHNIGEHGYTRNFENAIRNSRNNIIMLCDQDDIWKNNKIKTCLEELKNCDMVVHDAIVTDSECNVIHNSFFEQRKVNKSLIGNILKFGYLGCCISFKRKILSIALPFPSNQYYATHDNWLFLIGKAYFKCNIIYDKLILYRRHNYNVSSGGAKSNKSFVFKLTYRIYLILNLLKRKYKYINKSYTNLHD